MNSTIKFSGPWKMPINPYHVGSVLPLTENPQLFKKTSDIRLKLLRTQSLTTAQLKQLTPSGQYLSRISTDQIITVAHLLTDDLKLLGSRALCGLPPQYSISLDKLTQMKVKVLVAGPGFGVGSSREQAVSSLLAAGIKAIIAPSFGPIFEKNAANLGLLTTTDMSLIQPIQSGQPINFDNFTQGKNHLMQQIIYSGGLLKFLKTRKKNQPNTIQDKNRPLNIWEKRLAIALGLNSINIGKTYYLPVDTAYSYVALSGPVRHALLKAYGKIKTKIKPIFFEDHFALSTKPEIAQLTLNQRNFAKELNLPSHHYHFGRRMEGGGAGISHRVMLESINPTLTKVVIATDSHTPTLGALPLIAIPVGSTIFAAGIAEAVIPISIANVLRVNLTGKLPPGLSIRDVQLELAATVKISPGTSVVEFGGTGLKTLTLGNVASVCNMVPEVFIGAEIAITESYPSGVEYLVNHHHLNPIVAEKLFQTPDPGCTYSQIINFKISKTSPWIAQPGSPNSGLPLSKMTTHPVIHKAYIVSCTNGIEELKEAAAVLHGKQVNKLTQLIIIPSSHRIYEEAKSQGYIDILIKSGAIVRDEIACSACIGDGPDALNSNEIAISATNRNFQGRMGHQTAKVYLSGAILVALAAKLGRIPTHSDYLKEKSSLEINPIYIS